MSLFFSFFFSKVKIRLKFLCSDARACVFNFLCDPDSQKVNCSGESELPLKLSQASIPDFAAY